MTITPLSQSTRYFAHTTLRLAQFWSLLFLAPSSDIILASSCFKIALTNVLPNAGFVSITIGQIIFIFLIILFKVILIDKVVYFTTHTTLNPLAFIIKPFAFIVH